MTVSIKEQRGLKEISEYVPGKPIEEVQREYGLEDVIKLASNENPMGAPVNTIAAMKEQLDNLNIYPDARGYYLRKAIGEKFGLSMEQIAVGNGEDGLIKDICMAYLDEESEVLVSRSSFPIYDIYAKAMRATLVKTPLKDYCLDLEAMAEAINDRTRIVFVCNHNNPTGTIVKADGVDTFMRQVPDHVLAVFDEAYYEFVASGAYPEMIEYIRKGRKNVMILRSFSKAYGIAGIRLGYAIAPPETLAPVHKIREPFGVNLLAQAAGIAALQEEEFLRSSLAVNEAGRLFFYANAKRLGLMCLESHANFVLLEVGPRAIDIQQDLLKKGIIVRPCVAYDMPHFLRVTIGTKDQNARFIEALEGVLQDKTHG